MNEVFRTVKVWIAVFWGVSTYHTGGQLPLKMLMKKNNRDKKRKVGNYMFLKATKGHTANAGYICWSNSFSDVESMSPTCIQEKIVSTYFTSYKSVKLNKAKCGLQVFFH
jgi:hypothetical protein